ncbi:MAG: TonB family protein [Cyclobacteriaceae bacterium]
MEAKKSPKADLKNYRSLIFGLSFLITLSCVITAFEWKTYGDGVIVIKASDMDNVDPPIIPISTKIPPPPKPVQITPILVEVPDDEKIKEEVVIDAIPDQPVTPIKINIAPPAAEDKPDIFDVVEETAEPIGGVGAFYSYISDKMKYPAQARRIGVEGRVFVQFVINVDGSLTDIKVIKGIGAGCDEEAIRVLQSAPPWKPGKQRGVPVRQRMVIPITFKLG